MNEEKKLTPKQQLAEKILGDYQELSNMLAKLAKYANRLHAAQTFLGASHGLTRAARMMYAGSKLKEIPEMRKMKTENAPLCVAKSKIEKSNIETLKKIRPSLADQIAQARVILEDFENSAMTCTDLIQTVLASRSTHPQMDRVIGRISTLISDLFARYPDLAIKQSA